MRRLLLAVTVVMFSGCGGDGDGSVVFQNDDVIVLDGRDDLLALQTMWDGLSASLRTQFCQVVGTPGGAEQLYSEMSKSFVYERASWNAFLDQKC